MIPPLDLDAPIVPARGPDLFFRDDPCLELVPEPVIGTIEVYAPRLSSGGAIAL